MPNFEKMFYMSQATIAKTIDTLEKTNAKLKECMRYCEHGVAEEDSEDIENNDSESK